MEFVSLNTKIDQAGKEKLRNVQLFGADNFRSWMLYFEPGDGTPMHYHQSPETFLVIDGTCSVKVSAAMNGSSRKMTLCSFLQRNITSSSTQEAAGLCYSAIAPSLSVSARCERTRKLSDEFKTCWF